jgi:D-alanyl-D-alanine carboxypeptidase/D-alanyl-D-alanine-endopeptidase (penicillin-binding protein 4)
VPSKWLWEDAGNYYGAGAYGLSVFDNTYEIHFKTTNTSSQLEITEIVPKECRYEFTNWLVAAGTADEGYVFAAPYSTNGWLAGTIPANIDDFVLKASIADPPRLIAKMVSERLRIEGIAVTGEPSTVRLEQRDITEKVTIISEILSPPLSEIIEVLNHESMNLYAEHLLKELGKSFKGKGSTSSGIEVVMEFLQNTGVKSKGMFIEDGSGLSPLNAINTSGLARLLNYMKTEGKYFPYYLNSLPEAGKEGTLKNNFRDPVFESRLKAKSGSMTRVRCYAGYFKTMSGKDISFAIIINNYTGSSKYIISAIEEILKEMILHK